MSKFINYSNKNCLKIIFKYVTMEKMLQITLTILNFKVFKTF